LRQKIAGCDHREGVVIATPKKGRKGERDHSRKEKPKLTLGRGEKGPSNTFLLNIISNSWCDHFSNRGENRSFRGRKKRRHEGTFLFQVEKEEKEKKRDPPRNCSPPVLQGRRADHYDWLKEI